MSKLILAFRSTTAESAKALTWAFPVAGYPDIDIIYDPKQDYSKYKNIVIFGNSFGILKGSSWECIEGVIADKIYTYYDGFLTIGLATICHLGPKRIIYAPIVNSTESIDKTLGVFLALKGVLKAVSIYNENHLDDPITELLIDDYFKDMNPIAAAYQLKTAYDAYKHSGELYDSKGQPEAIKKVHKQLLTVDKQFDFKSGQ
jgi:hypothetical protein